MEAADWANFFNQTFAQAFAPMNAYSNRQREERRINDERAYQERIAKERFKRQLKGERELMNQRDRLQRIREATAKRMEILIANDRYDQISNLLKSAVTPEQELYGPAALFALSPENLTEDDEKVLKDVNSGKLTPADAYYELSAAGKQAALRFIQGTQMAEQQAALEQIRITGIKSGIDISIDPQNPDNPVTVKRVKPPAAAALTGGGEGSGIEGFIEDPAGATETGGAEKGGGAPTQPAPAQKGGSGVNWVAPTAALIGATSTPRGRALIKRGAEKGVGALRGGGSLLRRAPKAIIPGVGQLGVAGLVNDVARKSDFIRDAQDNYSYDVGFKPTDLGSLAAAPWGLAQAAMATKDVSDAARGKLVSSLSGAWQGFKDQGERNRLKSSLMTEDQKNRLRRAQASGNFQEVSKQVDAELEAALRSTLRQ